MNVFSSFIKLNFTNKFYVIFISCFWPIGYFSSFWRRLGLEDSGIIISNFIFMMILAILCVKKWLKRIRIFDFALYVFFVAVYFANSFFYPRTAELVSTNALDVVIGTLPFYFVGLMFKYEGCERWIAISARLAVVLNILYTFMISDTGNAIERMNRAYILLPSVLYILWQLMDRFNFIDFFYFAIGFFFECSLGSRGPFVCIVFFCASYYFFFKEYKHKKLMRVLTLFLALLLYIGSTYFAYLMVALLSMTGRSTRIFDLMLNDALVNYEESNGRDTIQSFLFQKLSTDVSGHGFGLFADRLYNDAYAHNIFVELWFAYGYYLGSIIIGVFLIVFVLFVIRSNSKTGKNIALLFFTASFIKLQFSGTFITDSLFFFLIGFCLNGLRELKESTKHNLSFKRN